MQHGQADADEALQAALPALESAARALEEPLPVFGQPVPQTDPPRKSLFQWVKFLVAADLEISEKPGVGQEGYRRGQGNGEPSISSEHCYWDLR